LFIVFSHKVYKNVRTDGFFLQLISTILDFFKRISVQGTSGGIQWNVTGHSGVEFKVSIYVFSIFDLVTFGIQIENYNGTNTLHKYRNIISDIVQQYYKWA
jgi:hypothetical protein